MQHFEQLTKENIQSLKVHETFTYKTIFENKVYYKKGLKVSSQYIIPIGLTCESIGNAQKQN